MFQRITVLVIDSVGIGAQPDAVHYNSIGSNTFLHTAKAHPNFLLPNLERLGMGNIVGVEGIPSFSSPMAHYGRMTEVTSGNDTFAGVWEMAGVIFKERFESFYPIMPAKLVDELQRYVGVGTLCNAYISGFKVFDLYADEHFSSSCPIVYTCDDGVVLIAAHEEVIAPATLHEIARKMSQFFVGKNVTRIIARAFIGNKGNFIRTENRADIVVPFDNGSDHLFQRLKEANAPFTATEHLTSLIGKEFATTTILGFKNSPGTMDDVCEYLRQGIDGIAMFVVPDFDMSGHLRNPKQYALDLLYFDRRLGEVLQLLGDNDLLFIVADHGCDPSLDIRGHTREYVPLLAFNGNQQIGSDLGTRETFADLGQTICELVKADPISVGKSFAQQLTTEVNHV